MSKVCYTSYPRNVQNFGESYPRNVQKIDESYPRNVQKIDYLEKLIDGIKTKFALAVYENWRLIKSRKILACADKPQ